MLLRAAPLVRLLGIALLALTTIGAQAQQATTGTPGSPDATTTIDGRYLPPPPQLTCRPTRLSCLLLVAERPHDFHPIEPSSARGRTSSGLLPNRSSP